MIHEKISENGPSLSRIILGGWRWNDRSFDLPQREKFVEKALELNITSFDHADIYGNYNCQHMFGELLKTNKSLRDKVEIISKCGLKPVSNKFRDRRIIYYDTSKEHIVGSTESSLKELQTDYLDVLLIHRPDPLMDPDEMAEAFYQLKKESKVRYFGLSNFTNEQFQMVQSRLDFPLVTNQLEFSLSHNKPLFNGSLDFLLKEKISPMVWSPFGGGKIFGNKDLMEKLTPLTLTYKCDISTLLIAWLVAHPSKVFPVVGTMNPKRLNPIVDGLDIQLERQDWYLMLKYARGFDVP